MTFCPQNFFVFESLSVTTRIQANQQNKKIKFCIIQTYDLTQQNICLSRLNYFSKLFKFLWKKNEQNWQIEWRVVGEDRKGRTQRRSGQTRCWPQGHQGMDQEAAPSQRKRLHRLQNFGFLSESFCFRNNNPTLVDSDKRQKGVLEIFGYFLVSTGGPFL